MLKRLCSYRFFKIYINPKVKDIFKSTSFNVFNTCFLYEQILFKLTFEKVDL